MNKQVKKQQGGIAIFVAFLMLIIIPLMGLAIDGAFILLKRNELQNVADATALACLIKNRAQACGSLSNGPHANINVTANSDIVPLNPARYNILATYPYTPCINARQDCAQAIASTDYRTFFIRIFGVPNVNLRARAVAGKSISDCMIVSRTMRMNGTPDVTGTNCNIRMGNADDPGTGIQTASNNYIYNDNSPAMCSACRPAAISTSGPVPVPVLSNPPIWRSNSIGTYGNFQCKSGTCNLLPGYYPNGINCSSSNVTCVFATGNYYLDGPLDLSGSNAHATDNGSGVFFYMRGTGSDGQINITAGGLVNLSNRGGTGGNCEDTNNQLLIYSPNSYRNTQVLTLNGSTSSLLVGNIYLPGYDIVWRGGNNMRLNGTLIVANYSQNGTNNLAITNTLSCRFNAKISLIE